jgi:hypothetical protein
MAMPDVAGFGGLITVIGSAWPLRGFPSNKSVLGR